MTRHRRARLAKMEKALANLGRWVLSEYCDEIGYIDGGSIQDKALEFGLLEQRTMTKPCGEHCECFSISDGPHDCFFIAKGIRFARQAGRKG